MFRFELGQTSRTVPRSRSIASTRGSSALRTPWPMRSGSSVSSASAHLVGATGLPGMNRQAQPGPAALGEDLRVVRESEVLRDRPGDVDPDHATAPPADRLRGDDLVQRGGERQRSRQKIEPGPHLRVLEDRPVHAADGRGDDVVEVLLPAAVALHRVEAQLELVTLFLRYAPPMTSYTLRSTAIGLDWISSVQWKRSRYASKLRRRRPDRDEVAERPVVLGRAGGCPGRGRCPT